MRSYLFLLSAWLLEGGLERLVSLMPCSQSARSLNTGRFLQGYTLANVGFKAAFTLTKKVSSYEIPLLKTQSWWDPVSSIQVSNCPAGSELLVLGRATYDNDHLSADTFICLNFSQNPHGHPNAASQCWTKQQTKKPSHQVYFQHYDKSYIFPFTWHLLFHISESYPTFHSDKLSLFLVTHFCFSVGRLFITFCIRRTVFYSTYPKCTSERMLPACFSTRARTWESAQMTIKRNYWEFGVSHTK